MLAQKSKTRRSLQRLVLIASMFMCVTTSAESADPVCSKPRNARLYIGDCAFVWTSRDICQEYPKAYGCGRPDFKCYKREDRGVCKFEREPPTPDRAAAQIRINFSNGKPEFAIPEDQLKALREKQPDLWVQLQSGQTKLVLNKSKDEWGKWDVFVLQDGSGPLPSGSRPFGIDATDFDKSVVTFTPKAPDDALVALGQDLLDDRRVVVIGKQEGASPLPDGGLQVGVTTVAKPNI